jgi:hypothetical protein
MVVWGSVTPVMASRMMERARGRTQDTVVETYGERNPRPPWWEAGR